MEALSIDVLNERVKNLDVRTRSTHDALAVLRREQGSRSEVFARLEEKVDNQAADISELRDAMKWIQRGLMGAIAVGLMFVVAVATLVVQVAS